MDFFLTLLLPRQTFPKSLSRFAHIFAELGPLSTDLLAPFGRLLANLPGIAIQRQLKRKALELFLNISYNASMGSLIGNIIWLIFGGFTAALGCITAGLATCATIIGIPIGLKQISLGASMALPFGKEVKSHGEVTTLQTVLNIVWFILFGWILVLNHLLFGLLLTLTVVGIPFAKQHWKLLKLSAFPFGKTFEPIA